MKHELVKTENYLLVVDDSEIKEGDFCLADIISSDFYGVVKYNGAFAKHYYKKIIAHLPLNDSADLKRVLLLPPLEVEDDFNPIDEYDKEYLSSLTFDGKSFVSDVLLATRLGYNKARETYKFTEEDIEKAIAYGLNCKRMDAGEIPYMTMGDFYESLSRPKIPTHFEVEMGTKYFEDSRWETHPMLVDNKEGQTILLGTYIYE